MRYVLIIVGEITAANRIALGRRPTKMLCDQRVQEID